MKSIPFFSDEIRIKPHSAVRAGLLDRAVSIREFSNGRPVSLYEHENGELEARCGNDFIQGPEVCDA